MKALAVDKRILWRYKPRKNGTKGNFAEAHIKEIRGTCLGLVSGPYSVVYTLPFWVKRSDIEIAWVGDEITQPGITFQKL